MVNDAFVVTIFICGTNDIGNDRVSKHLEFICISTMKYCAMFMATMEPKVLDLIVFYHLLNDLTNVLLMKMNILKCDLHMIILPA